MNIAENNELLLEYSKTKNVEIRNKLVLKYDYIAQISAKKFVNKGVPYDDLYQVAMLAIIKAIDRFDISKNVLLSTFLTHSAIGEIKNYFRDKVSILKVSRDIKLIFNKIKIATDKYMQDHLTSPSPQDIADILHIDVEKVIEGMEYNYGTISFDSDINDGENSLYEIIEDVKSNYAQIENEDFFNSCLKVLSELEAKILYLRFKEEKSQSGTAKELGVSQMMVSRMERKILLKLKELV